LRREFKIHAHVHTKEKNYSIAISMLFYKYDFYEIELSQQLSRQLSTIKIQKNKSNNLTSSNVKKFTRKNIIHEKFENYFFNK